MKNGVELIAEERERQKNEEGWTAEHDASHAPGALMEAAYSYWTAGTKTRDLKMLSTAHARQFCKASPAWPFESDWWKPSANPIRNFVKAGALCLAEIARSGDDSRVVKDYSLHKCFKECADEIDKILSKPVRFYWLGESSEIYAAYDQPSLREHIIVELGPDDVPGLNIENQGSDWGYADPEKIIADEKLGNVTIAESIRYWLPYIENSLPWQVSTCYA